MNATHRSVLRDKVLVPSAGAAVAAYLKLVKATTRFGQRTESAKVPEPPFIAVTWHGKQLLSHAALPDVPLAVLVSKHVDGQIIGAAARYNGFQTVAGSGSHDPRKIEAKGGASAFRRMLRLLHSGTSVAMTADVPKVARRVGQGVISLAALSGRPIVAFAAVTSARIDLENWDEASIVLPFGRGAVVWAEPLPVPGSAARDAPDLRLELARRLHSAHHEAYACIGG
jgi:lysophospholipid acyltransferase (LPLAT)-like uncharacterized protein